MDNSPSQHNHGGLSKLLPNSLSAKRQRSKRSKNKSPSKNGEESLDPESLRGRRRSLKNRGTDDRRSVNEEDSDGRSFGSNGSSLGQGRGRSSTRSRPSTSPQPRSHQQPQQQQQQQQPSPHPVRPVPSAHPSLIGYLTTSSPVVQAEHLDSAAQVQPARVASRSPSGRSATVSTSSPLKEIPNNSNTPSLGAPILEPPAPVKVASPTKSPRPRPKVELEAPKTPPTADRDSPVIVNTPPTPTDHSHAFLPPSPERRGPAGSRSPTDGSSPTRVINSHRRSKSGSATIVPSKLSTITAAPLTPTPETGEAASSNQGFFSTVFSAAQNAATTLSSNIPGAGIGIGGSRKSSANVAKSQISPAPSVPDLDNPDNDASVADMSEKRNSAIHTLGTGELSLSQLGLADPPAGGANGTTPANAAAMKFPDVIDSRTRSESAPVELNTPELDQGEHLQPGSRPRSIAESPSAEDLSGISQSELADTPATVQRSTSVTSAMKSHRKRGSSTTNGAIAAGISAATAVAPIASPPKLTGFAIASKKRNRDFHSFFKSVPDDDYLIEDYSCALQREILAHGRLYVSEGHLCFSSNILGWTTTLVMSFDEIVSVEKRSTALVFKNGLMISTLHAKHIFASFTSRDATYDLIVNIWKLGHPTLKSTLNGVQLEGTGGDKTEKIDSEPLGLGIDNEILAGSDSEELSDEDSDEDDEDEFYDEEEHDELIDTQPTEVSGADGDAEKPPFRKASTMSTANGQSPDAQKETPSSPGGGTDFPGPAAHPPTDCGDSASHYDKFLLDEIVPAPLGKVYSLVFGPASPNYMSKWLANDQKCWDVEMEDKKGLSLDNKTRTYSYIKPLYASLGPKQTKCIVSETVENLDYEKAININGSTQTPDVPSGSLFTVKTKYCLSWAENNATRFQINCTVEWSGKSWIKGPVEKGVSDGQGQYCKELFAGLKAAVSRARANTGANGAGKKKKSRKSKANTMSREAGQDAAKRTGAAKANWGPLEPVRPVLEPVVDILKPVLTGNVMYGLLVGLLVASWFGFGFSPSRNTPTLGHDLDLFGPYRTAAYEEMWRREESELWDWLEERVGLERLNKDGIQSHRRAAEPRTMEERLRDERMDDREVNEAIRVTEEKLKILRQVVSKSKQSHGVHSEL